MASLEEPSPSDSPTSVAAKAVLANRDMAIAHAITTLRKRLAFLLSFIVFLSWPSYQVRDHKYKISMIRRQDFNRHLKFCPLSWHFTQKKRLKKPSILTNLKTFFCIFFLKILKYYYFHSILFHMICALLYFQGFLGLCSTPGSIAFPASAANKKSRGISRSSFCINFII